MSLLFSEKRSVIVKKLLVILIAMTLVCGIAFAATNSQKIYSVDSEVYKSIEKIYVMTGHALPSTTGPWSGDELTKMIEAIDRNDVPDLLKATYDKVLETLGEKADVEFKGGALNFNGTVALDIYFHTYDSERAESDGLYRDDVYPYLEDKTDDGVDNATVNYDKYIREYAFSGRQWWYGTNLNHITPFFEFEIENYLNDHVYFVFDMPLQNGFRSKQDIGSTMFSTNVLMFQNLSFYFNDFDIASFPHRAFAAVGGDGWSIEVGRDRLRWGAGTTGNTVLSDNFPYHDMFRATAYGEKLKYTYLVSFFPSKLNYYDEYGFQGLGSVNSTNQLDGLFFYTAHRFEFRLFKDKVGFTLTEGLMYASPTNNIEIQALSPIYFMHNAFMPKNSNSTLAFEVDWTIIKGLNVYGQLLLDQGRMPGIEAISGQIEPGESPDGNAYLVGAKYMLGLKGGVLTINPEFAYVSPFCYLRDSGYTSEYGMDYVGAVKSRLYGFEDRSNAPDIIYEDYVIGYTYGPDCMVANLAADWEGEKLSLSANGMLIVHGTHDPWTKWTETPEGLTDEKYEEAYEAEFSGISTSHAYTSNYRYLDEKDDRNAKWYTLDIGLGARYQFTDAIEASLNVDYVLMKNVFNVASSKYTSDIQIILGATYKCF